MTRDHRFEEAYNEAYTKDGMEGGPHTMCEFLDNVERKGRTEGKQEMALSLAKMGIPLDKIAEAAKVSVETVKQWLASPQQGAAK